MGMAVGDAVGVPLEFITVLWHPRDPNRPSFDLTNCSYEKPFNKFKLQFGQFSDDTSKY